MAPLKKIKIEYVFIVFLIVISSYLRFKNLGYSDYIGDEHKAFIELAPGETIMDFFMNQRKGPMQFLVSYIPYMITHDFRNELAQRIPFTIISVFGVFAFYLFVKKFTKDATTAVIASFLMSANGFILGFSKIAQYQNLNILFSFLALFFYSDLLDKNTKLIRSTLLGTLFFILSVLSHWDAIFVLPIIIYIFTKFIINKKLQMFYKKRILVINVIFGCLLLLPFLIPYGYNQIKTPANMTYFSRRVDSTSESPISQELIHKKIGEYILLFKLYNPFIVFEFILITSLLGLIFYKKSFPFTLWFLYSFLLFLLFARKPGTHIYNFVLPLIVISSIGIANVVKKVPLVIKVLLIFLVGLFLSFFYYQSYRVFVDHSLEYPWQQKNIFPFKDSEKYTSWVKKKFKHKTPKEGEIIRYSILEPQWWETPKYYYEQKLPLFGFPHKRYWNEINEWVNEQNLKNNEGLSFISNEVQTISGWYMNTKYSGDEGYYIVGVKYPLSFVNDYKFPQIGKKTEVKNFTNEFGTVVVKIYRVEK